MATAGVAQAIIDEQKWLDTISDAVQPNVKNAFSKTGEAGKIAKDLLNGVWLGHSLHSALTDVPIGAWTIATIFDVISMAVGDHDNLDRASDLAMGIGVVGAFGAAAAGIADWSDTRGSTRRMGTAHAVINVAGLVLNIGSMALRTGGRRNRGKARFLSFAAYGATTLSAFLGGELVYSLGMGVNRNAWTSGPKKYKEVTTPANLSDSKMHHIQVEGNDVVLVRDDDGLHAFGGVCSHLGCGLWEGKLNGHIIECQCHGSQFDITDGKVIHGPATASLPSYDVVDHGDHLQIREKA